MCFEISLALDLLLSYHISFKLFSVSADLVFGHLWFLMNRESCFHRGNSIYAVYGS